MALSEEERKVIRGAIEILGRERNLYSSIKAIWEASFESPISGFEARNLVDKFRDFYDERGCPFIDEPNSWRLQTRRILLLETFLIFDGEL